MAEILKDAASEPAKRAMASVMRMKKFDLAALRKAYTG